MSKLRFVFEKTGRARYLSHLDLMRTFQRAFKRAGLELKHSEGFNPHPQMSVLLPLQLGCESVC
ncbi:MAG: TIGR03936 family radical SAM-associated protein [Oscillospiraceae bacterium]|nr:TIGR03936 family radical SAM-associated protein [Oscillospiraceae bacterium]